MSQCLYIGSHASQHSIHRMPSCPMVDLLPTKDLIGCPWWIYCPTWYTGDPIRCLHVPWCNTHKGSQGCPHVPLWTYCTQGIPWDARMSHGGLTTYTWNPMGCLRCLTAHCGTHGIPWDVCMSRLCRAVPLSIPSHGTHGMSTCPDYTLLSLCPSRPIVPRDVCMSRLCRAVPWSIQSHSPMGSHGMSTCP